MPLGRQPTLGWPVRNSIALGVANGLAYLHEECVRTIIHRDVKAANILLDEDFQAVLADFSLAEFMDCHDDLHIIGTYGHMAPEYMLAGKFTEKADVFSYGIFLLELITGQFFHKLQPLAYKNGMQLLEMVSHIYIAICNMYTKLKNQLSLHIYNFIGIYSIQGGKF